MKFLMEDYNLLREIISEKDKEYLMGMIKSKLLKRDDFVYKVDDVLDTDLLMMSYKDRVKFIDEHIKDDDFNINMFYIEALYYITLIFDKGLKISIET